MSKEEVEQHLRELEEKVEKLREEIRLEWLRQIFNEARDDHGFKTLGELIALIVDHASDISHAE